MRDLKMLRKLIDRLIDNIDESLEISLEERGIICKKENLVERQIMNRKREQVLVAESQKLCQTFLKDITLQKELNLSNAFQTEIF